MTQERYDDAVVGAGILGLAHAYHLARRGRRVLVVERSSQAQGASIRNFGMIWPVGQPHGERHQLALRSREHWLEALAAAGLWHERTGSLHLAQHDDEAEVLREFAKQAPDLGYACELLSPTQVAERSPAVVIDGLVAGLWSPTEVCVDPREAVAGLARFLAAEHGVHFAFGCAASGWEPGCLRAGGREIRVERLFCCPGDDLVSLFPEALAPLGLRRSKLQMMRSTPRPDRIGPMLAGGLTLRHYAAFGICPSLEAVVERVAREAPEFDRFGIHVMVSQNGRQELVIGDSHVYDDAIDPFDSREIDRLVLAYLAGMAHFPDLEIAARWHGTYAKDAEQAWQVVRPAPGAWVVTGVGGAGMTLSFGVAERVVDQADAPA